MILLGVDVETTGLNHLSDEVTEVGAVLWCTEKSTPLRLFSKFVQAKVPISEEITQLTGITQEMVDKYGEPADAVAEELKDFAKDSEALVAHNAVFDINFLNGMGFVYDRPVIDTRVDIKYPGFVTTRKLTHLAADHGFANPFAHRALFDVLTMLRVLEKYDFYEVLARSKEPLVRASAQVSFAKKDLAKARGYSWDADNKTWFKEMKKSDAELEAKEAPFNVSFMEV